MTDAVLAPADAGRVAATLARLARAGLREVAVTGGTAIAWHLGRATGRPTARPLNDLDLVVPGRAAFEARFPPDVLLGHLHPDALPGRLLVQAVDRAAALRVDVFGAFGGQFARSRPAPFLGGALRIVSAGDLAARLAALLLDLDLGEPVPAKHARDFAALGEAMDPVEASPAWADHRRPRHPPDFAQARRRVLELIRERPGLLVAKPRFDVTTPCPKCRDVPGLALARPEAIAAALGLP